MKINGKINFPFFIPPASRTQAASFVELVLQKAPARLAVRKKAGGSGGGGTPPGSITIMKRNLNLER